MKERRKKWRHNVRCGFFCSVHCAIPWHISMSFKFYFIFIFSWKLLEIDLAKVHKIKIDCWNVMKYRDPTFIIDVNPFNFYYLFSSLLRFKNWFWFSWQNKCYSSGLMNELFDLIFIDFNFSFLRCFFFFF